MVKYLLLSQHSRPASESFYSIDPDKQVLTIDSSYRIDIEAADQMSVASSQKIIAMVQVKELDIMIALRSDGLLCHKRFFYWSEYPSFARTNINACQNLYYAKTSEGKEILIATSIFNKWTFPKSGLYSVATPYPRCPGKCTTSGEYNKTASAPSIGRKQFDQWIVIIIILSIWR